MVTEQQIRVESFLTSISEIFETLILVVKFTLRKCRDYQQWNASLTTILYDRATEVFIRGERSGWCEDGRLGDLDSALAAEHRGLSGVT